MKNQGNNIRLPLSFIPIFFSLFNRQWNTFFQHNDQRSTENFFGSDLEEADLSHGGGGDEEGSGRGWFVVIMRGVGGGVKAGEEQLLYLACIHSSYEALALALGKKKLILGRGLLPGGLDGEIILQRLLCLPTPTFYDMIRSPLLDMQATEERVGEMLSFFVTSPNRLRRSWPTRNTIWASMVTIY